MRTRVKSYQITASLAENLWKLLLLQTFKTVTEERKHIGQKKTVSWTGDKVLRLLRLS